MPCFMVLLIPAAVIVVAYYHATRRSSAPHAPRRDTGDDLIPLHANEGISLTQAFEGVIIFGAPGSGKSSGSGHHIARCLFESGMGGCITTAKPTDTIYWQKLAQACGRSDDLIILSAEGPHRFDAFEYESSRSGPGAGLTTNLLRLVRFSLDIANRGKEGGGGESDGYWQRAAEEVAGNAMDLCLATQRKATLPAIAKIIASAPYSLEQLQDRTWQRDSFCFQAITRGHQEEKRLGPRRHDFEQSSLYFLEAFPNLSEKTRSVIVSHFSGMVRPLLRYPVRDVFFAGGTNVDPLWSRQGRIFLLDFSVKQYLHVGTFVQAMFKFAWQTAMERSQGPRENPVFLFSDECHLTLAPVYDRTFFSTSRSAKAINVLITQNLPTLYATIPNKDEVDAIVGNFATKVFHQNQCTRTNEFAAETIGKVIKYRGGYSTNASYQDGVPGQCGSGNVVNEQWEYKVPPITFTQLQKGGREFGGLTQAVIVGPRFSSGDNVAACQFQQES